MRFICVKRIAGLAFAIWQSSLKHECLMTDARCPSLLLSFSLENVFLCCVIFSIDYILVKFNHYFARKLTKCVTTQIKLIYVPKLYLKSNKSVYCIPVVNCRSDRTSLHCLLNQLVAQCSSFVFQFSLSAAKIQLFYPQ